MEDPQAPEGKCFVRFTNAEPGRTSMALQAFAVDGSQIKSLVVSLHVKAKNVRPGQSVDQLPRLMITFYDENRKPAAPKSVGPWRGDFNWKEESRTIPVPPSAREAVVHVGLLGAVGELDVDGVEIGPAPVEPERKPGKKRPSAKD